MDYQEAVEKEIEGDQDEIKRRKEIWGEIADSYEKGGENAISDTVTNESKSITKEFNNLLKKLEKLL